MAAQPHQPPQAICFTLPEHCPALHPHWPLSVTLHPLNRSSRDRSQMTRRFITRESLASSANVEILLGISSPRSCRMTLSKARPGPEPTCISWLPFVHPETCPHIPPHRYAPQVRGGGQRGPTAPLNVLSSGILQDGFTFQGPLGRTCSEASRKSGWTASWASL